MLLTPACSSQGLTVDVYAGSSLTNVLQSAEQMYESRNEGVDIRLNLGGSNTLSRQIAEGGGADVFIPADAGVLDDLPAGRVGGEPIALATNRLVMIVPAGSDIPSAGGEPTPTEVLDWAGSLARCATGVPCGDATDRWITASSGLPSPGTITIENNVRAVLTKVRTNEVDAGLVYSTDALVAEGDVEVVPLGSEGPHTSIVGVIIGPTDPDGDSMGRMFLDYLASDEGRALFRDAGFGQP